MVLQKVEDALQDPLKTMNHIEWVKEVIDKSTLNEKRALMVNQRCQEPNFGTH
jgi:hypothetical protein